MNKIYFTIVCAGKYFGYDIFKEGSVVHLEKEPDNQYDSEAIQIRISGLGTVGYVANSVNTVLGDCMSAGRIYDKIGNTASGRVLYIMPDAVVCELNSESLPSKSENI